MAKTTTKATKALEKDEDEIREAEQKALADSEVKLDKLRAEGDALGVSDSRVMLAGYKNKSKEGAVEKEMARQGKLLKKRRTNRIAKKKKLAKMKPIDIRRALLAGRLNAVKNEGIRIMRANAYGDKVIKAWIEEYNQIVNSPKQWNRLTSNGTMPYQPGNKKKTTRQLLDSMDLDLDS